MNHSIDPDRAASSSIRSPGPARHHAGVVDSADRRIFGTGKKLHSLLRGPPERTRLPDPVHLTHGVAGDMPVVVDRLAAGAREPRGHAKVTHHAVLPEEDMAARRCPAVTGNLAKVVDC